MKPLVDVMQANDQNGLTGDVFENRFNRLNAQIDDAVAACTSAVNDPAREVLYQFAKANAGFTICDTIPKNCTVKQITSDIQSGLRYADELEGALSAKS